VAFLIPANRSTLSFPHFCRCSRSVHNNWIPVLLWYCERKKKFHALLTLCSCEIQLDSRGKGELLFVKFYQLNSMFDNFYKCNWAAIAFRWVSWPSRRTGHMLPNRWNIQHSVWKPYKNNYWWILIAFLSLMDGHFDWKINDSLARWKVSLKLLSFCFSWSLDLSCLT
jgi:hypothetical protein